MDLDDFLWTARESGRRRPLAVALTIGAGAHIPVIGSHLSEAPYMGVEFIVLTVALMLVATGALMRDSAAVYAVSAVTCALAIAGFVLTRLVAFPQLAGNVGNWFEPLALVAVVAESAVIGVAVHELGVTGRRRVTNASSTDFERPELRLTQGKGQRQRREDPERPCSISHELHVFTTITATSIPDYGCTV